MVLTFSCRLTTWAIYTYLAKHSLVDGADILESDLSVQAMSFASVHYHDVCIFCRVQQEEAKQNLL